MTLSEIDDKILEIEENAKNSLAVASNGKTVLKTDLEYYETLIKMKALLDNPDVKANIEKYQEFAAILGIKQPPKKRTRKSSTPKQKKKVATEPVVAEEKKTEPVVSVVENTESVTEPIVKATEAPVIVPVTEPVVAVVPLLNPIEKKDPLLLGAGEPEVKKPEPITEVPTEAIVEDYSYRKTKGEIIQDLPLYDRSEQKFNDPGMSAEEIKASQEKLASIPVMSPEKAEAYVKESLNIPDIEVSSTEAPAYKPMSAEEIKAAQEKLGMNPASATPKAESYSAMTPEEIRAAQEKLGTTPASSSSESEGYKPMSDEEVKAAQEKVKSTSKAPTSEPDQPDFMDDIDFEPKKKKKKVTKRKGFFNWMKGSVKGFVVCKGIAFLENNMKRSEEFRKINDMLLNYRLVYKTRSIEENKANIDSINQTIGMSTTLPINEKIILLKRLRRIIQLTERRNKRLAKDQAKVDDLSAVIDDIDSVDLKR